MDDLVAGDGKDSRLPAATVINDFSIEVSSLGEGVVARLRAMGFVSASGSRVGGSRYQRGWNRWRADEMLSAGADHQRPNA
jgi:hypothetical protein